MANRNSIEMSQDTCRTGGGRIPYRSPELTVYGTVRNLTGGSAGTGTDGGLPTMMIPGTSDRRTKENIVEVARHPAGFGLYLFDYKPEHRDAFGHGRKFGVMADEVASIVPGAVMVDEDGFSKVYYSKLGIVLH